MTLQFTPGVMVPRRPGGKPKQPLVVTQGEIIPAVVAAASAAAATAATTTAANPAPVAVVAAGVTAPAPLAAKPSRLHGDPSSASHFSPCTG